MSSEQNSPFVLHLTRSKRQDAVSQKVQHNLGEAHTIRVPAWNAVPCDIYMLIPSFTSGHFSNAFLFKRLYLTGNIILTQLYLFSCVTTSHVTVLLFFSCLSFTRVWAFQGQIMCLLFTACPCTQSITQ